MMPASNTNWDDPVLLSKLNPSQLNKISRDLDLVTIAIAALTQIDRLEIGRVARDLQLSIDPGWLEEWTLGGVLVPPQLDAEQLRTIVTIVTHLAQAHQISIRQNINYWHQTLQADRLPLESPLLASYISRFISMYQTHFGHNSHESVEILSQAALNLLVELLFYSNYHGQQRLWGVLLQRSHIVTPHPASSQ